MRYEIEYASYRSTVWTSPRNAFPKDQGLRIPTSVPSLNLTEPESEPESLPERKEQRKEILQL